MDYKDVIDVFSKSKDELTNTERIIEKENSQYLIFEQQTKQNIMIRLSKFEFNILETIRNL